MTDNGSPALTHARDWKRKTFIETLPSGKVVELQRPSIISLALRSGRMPESLSKIVLDAINGRTQLGAQTGWSPNDPAEIADLMDAICRGAFVSPAIVDHPDYEQNQIAIDDVDEPDKLWVLTWAKIGGGQLPSASRSPEQSNGSLPAA